MTSLSTLSHSEKVSWFQRGFRPHFDEWVIAPAQRMIDSKDHVAMPAFIWITCAVDWLAGFWFGTDTKNQVKKAYTGFIDQYFPSNTYNSNELYDSLRNGLVHMFTIKSKQYALTHQNPNLHLQKTSNGQVILNLESFFSDVVSAKNEFFNDVEHSPEMLDKFIERYEREGFLNLIPITPTDLA